MSPFSSNDAHGLHRLERAYTAAKLDEFTAQPGLFSNKQKKGPRRDPIVSLIRLTIYVPLGLLPAA
jgi:hypothetical protein